MATKKLPYVTAALLCEKVLQESDGTVSAIRIIDRVQYRIEQALPPGVKPMLSVQGLICIKSGPVIGQHTLKVVSERPDGQRKDVHVQPVELRGKDHGINLILNIGIGVDQDGLFWFEVLFDDELLSRFPLLITPLPEQQQADEKGR